MAWPNLSQILRPWYASASPPPSSTDKVKVTALDTVAGYLSDKLSNSGDVQFASADQGGGNLALVASYTGGKLVQSSFGNSMSFSTYSQNAFGPGDLGTAMLKSMGVPLVAPLVGVKIGDLIRISYAVTLDFTGVGTAIDCRVTPWVVSDVAPLKGADVGYAGPKTADVMYSFSNVVAYVWNGADDTNLDVGMLIRMSQPDITATQGSSALRSSACNLCVDVYRGVTVTQAPLNTP